MKLEEHPTAKRYLEKKLEILKAPPPRVLDDDWVKSVILDAGADDVGLASIDSPELAEYRSRILRLYPHTKTIASVVCRMNPENVRSPYRQQYELEYHHMYAEVDHVARRAVVTLNRNGIGAMNTTSSYPMNMEVWPDNGMWWVAHKPVAVAAGMGRMGLHHLVVHPRLGSSIALTSVLIDREVAKYDQPIHFDTCVKCMLCVTSCPVGAFSADGHFNAIACTTHRYRDKYGGFADWVETIISSRSPLSYRKRVSDQETVLMWQSLALGTSYKCTNCMAVCPGGEDIIGPYVDDPKEYRNQIAKTLQERKEIVYVVKGSDAEKHARKRFPHKPVRIVGNGVRAASVSAFLDNLHILFQRGASEGLNACYHFTFRGTENIDATITIRDQTLDVKRGHIGTPDLRIIADSRTWVGFASKEIGPLKAFITGKIRIKGPFSLLRSFAQCFP